MSTFFTSDTHFNHKMILNFCPESRPFSTVEEMNEEIIRRHNNIVSYDDDVYFLGDCGFGSLKETIKLFNRLNGNKYLIIGNHDRKHLRDKDFVQIFVKVQSDSFIRLKHGNEILAFHMYHFPVWEWDQMHRGSYHLHGHVHGRKLPIDGRIMDVGLDCIHDDGEYLKPFSLDEIHRRMKKIQIRERFNEQ